MTRFRTAGHPDTWARHVTQPPRTRGQAPSPAAGRPDRSAQASQLAVKPYLRMMSRASGEPSHVTKVSAAWRWGPRRTAAAT